MKKIILVALILLPFYSNAQKVAVENAVKSFFTAFHAKDTLALRTSLHPKVQMQSIMESPKRTRLVEEKVGDFLKSIASIPADLKFEERILSYVVEVDGAMAHAWTPYEFYINGVKSHSGVNAFTFFLDNGQWKIIHLMDTRRK